MEYSKIAYLKIRDFRNIEDTTIDFTKKPIIALKGDNECGKTSVIKAFGVLGLNAWARNQKDFIRDGTEGFEIELGLENGTVIKRVKEKKINSYQIQESGKEKYEINKLDNGKIPPEIVDVLGLIEEPETKEYLHIRTYEDNLLFVTTTASLNYKVMYNALKVENIIRAIAKGNEEANALKHEINDNLVGQETLKENLKNIKIIDIEPLILMKKRIEEKSKVYEEILKANELLKNIEEIEKELKTLNEIINLSEIDIESLKNISRACSIFNDIKATEKELNILKEATCLKELDTNSLNALKRANDILYDIKNDSVELNKYSKITSMNLFDTDMLFKIQKGINLLNEIKNASEMIKMINLENIKCVTRGEVDTLYKIQQGIELKKSIEEDEIKIQEYKKEIKELNDYLKEQGAEVIECPNCGYAHVHLHNNLESEAK